MTAKPNPEVMGTCDVLSGPHPKCLNLNWKPVPTATGEARKVIAMRGIDKGEGSSNLPGASPTPSKLPTNEKFQFWRDDEGDYIIECQRPHQFLAADGKTPDDAVYVMRGILDMVPTPSPTQPNERCEVALLADVMHLWVDGYISKNPNSSADDSISDGVFERVQQCLEAQGIEVDYCGWRRKSPAQPLGEPDDISVHQAMPDLRREESARDMGSPSFSSSIEISGNCAAKIDSPTQQEPALPPHWCRIQEPDNPDFSEKFECKDCGENFITMCSYARLKSAHKAALVRVQELLASKKFHESRASVALANAAALELQLSAIRDAPMPDMPDTYQYENMLLDHGYEYVYFESEIDPIIKSLTEKLALLESEKKA